jgi:4-amino-4-deoxy-L-arabinose transferase-like glycosyltransferase
MHPPDSVEYDRLGWNLVAHGEYSLAEAAPRTPDLTRTPVFPLFVACCYWIGGHQPAVAVAAQLVLSVLTLGVLYVLGRRFFDALTALAATALLAFDPLSIRYGTLLLSETLFTLLFYSSLFCVVASLRQPRPVWMAASILLTGLAVLCRPIALLWPLALLLIFALVAWREKRCYPLLHYGLFLVGAYAIVSTWVVRNGRVGGVAVLSTVQGINLYYYRAAVVVADQQDLSLGDAQRLLRDRLQEKVEAEHLEYSQEYGLMEKWGLEISGAAPKHYLRAHLQGMARMFLPQKPRVALLGWCSSAIYWGEWLFLVPVYALAVVGLVAGLRGPDRLAVLLLSGVVVYFALLSGPEAYSRFRVPVMPALSLLAGAGLACTARLRWDGRADG